MKSKINYTAHEGEVHQMTTATESPVTTEIEVRAAEASRAWLNAFLATSKEVERPALYRTLCLEFFEGGIQLVGCDGTALFRTWVPRLDEKWPEKDEAPARSIVVMDTERFGLAFMKALYRVTSDEGRAAESLTLTVSRQDEDATLSLGTDFMTERVVLRSCGQRIDLKTYDGVFPNWRGAQLGIEDIERVDRMAVSTRLFGLVGKLKGCTGVELDFYGAKRHIAFVAKGEAEVRGLLMPMRRPDTEGEE